MAVTFAKLNAEETDTVHRIAERAVRMYRSAGVKGVRVIDVVMDIEAVHAHTPLRLAELAEADDFNFSHDIGGIGRHLNRQTGKLENFFLPRYAR